MVTQIFENVFKIYIKNASRSVLMKRHRYNHTYKLLPHLPSYKILISGVFSYIMNFLNYLMWVNVSH